MYELKGEGSSVSNEEHMQLIVDKISNGIPLVIGYNTSKSSGHAINAMRILRDFNDPYVYYLECYDNNSLKNPYLFKIVQSDLSFWNKTSVTNWGKNYAIRCYRLIDEEWQPTTLRFMSL